VTVGLFRRTARTTNAHFTRDAMWRKQITGVYDVAIGIPFLFVVDTGDVRET